MTRKGLYILLVVGLLLVGPASVVLAQRPEPPKLDAAMDVQNLPETLQKAVALQESLTAEQHAAVRAILDKHLPEMEALNEILLADMPALPGAAAGRGTSFDVLPADGEPAAEPELELVDRDAMGQLQAVVQDIDAEMATVLDADQLALYRAVVQPSVPSVDAAPKEAGSPTDPQGYTTNCFYGAYYDAYAEARAWLAYLYGYYDYYYYGYTYAYYTYYYAYQTYVYSRYALGYSAPVYFTYYYFNQYTSSYPYYAYYYSSYAETYGYYAYYYGYYNYYYYGSGSTYGYYAYYYAYYAYRWADYAHYYTYYCYYYS